MYLVLFLLFNIISVSVSSYRFVCNGYLADGVERNDECGVCDEKTAARWQNPNVYLTVDSINIPSFLTKEDWNLVIEKSFNSWNSIPDSRFRFIRLDSEPMNLFGVNDQLHEVFWITDEEQWKEQVGAGAFGALGVTTPKYRCPDEYNQNRVIYDADLVLNGLYYINWALECSPNEDCVSIEATLTHELGHVIGLDHPCVECSTSIMSARSGNGLTKPAKDDILGIQALYPMDYRPLGYFGDSCTNEKDCSLGMNCIYDKKENFCSNSCKENTDCEENSFCNKNINYCSLTTSEEIPRASLYEDCSIYECEKPLICVGKANSYHCFSPCLNDENCLGNNKCIKLRDETHICIKVSELNEQCSNISLCNNGLVCSMPNNAHEGICKKSCESSLCATNEVCKLINNKYICLNKKEGLLDEKDTKSHKNNDFLSCNSLNKNNNYQFMIILITFWFIKKKILFNRLS